MRDRENLKKFDAKSDKGYFRGYSSTSRAYKVYNLITKIVMESSNVVINDELCLETHLENTPPVQEKTVEVDDPIPDDYIEKHGDEELLLLNDAVLIPSSQNHLHQFMKLNKNKVSLVLHQNKKVPLHLWSKVHLLE